ASNRHSTGLIGRVRRRLTGLARPQKGVGVGVRRLLKVCCFPLPMAEPIRPSRAAATLTESARPDGLPASWSGRRRGLLKILVALACLGATGGLLTFLNRFAGVGSWFFLKLAVIWFW